MEPTSQWVADYGDETCALRRAFRAGDQHAVVEFQQFAPGIEFSVAVMSDTVRRTRHGPKARFEPDADWEESWLFGYADNGDSQGVIFLDNLLPNTGSRNAPPAMTAEQLVARERSIAALDLSETFERPLVLQTGSMHAPMNALRACMDDLLTRWGLDPAQQHALSRAAEPRDNDRWMRRVRESYPRSMRRNGVSTIFVRLLVDAEGKPARCNVLFDFTFTDLQASACENLTRDARFDPALDSQGQPVASVYSVSMLYMIS